MHMNTQKKIFNYLHTLLLVFFCLLIIITSNSIQAKSSKSNNTPPPAGPINLDIVQQEISIDGKPVKIFNIVQPDGTFGLVAEKGKILDVVVKNKTDVPTTIHWHGLIVPNNQDGIAFVTQQPIPPGGEYHYKFPLIQYGTFWIHSPYKIQLQKLMAAPLIVNNPKDTDKNIQDVVMFLQDFTFQDPKEIYPKLRQQLLQKQSNIQLSNNETDETSEQTEKPDEIAMDAYLTNHRTLSDPDIFRIPAGTTIRLRVINAAANSNFFIDLGNLTGKLVAVDSEPIEPVEGSKFQVGQGQRLDIQITMPEGDNAYPILAQAENTSKLTGLVLATPNAIVPKYNENAKQVAGELDYSQEMNLKAIYPLLPHGLNRSYTIKLDNNMLSYIWTMNNQVWPNIMPLKIREDERDELVLNNKTAVPIPIHFHGHVFQVVQINDTKLKGAIRDTVLVLPNSTVRIQFDTDNPGIWLLQGAVPFLNYGRMATTLNYENYPMPIFNQKDTGIPPKL